MVLVPIIYVNIRISGFYIIPIHRAILCFQDTFMDTELFIYFEKKDTELNAD